MERGEGVARREELVLVGWEGKGRKVDDCFDVLDGARLRRLVITVVNLKRRRTGGLCNIVRR